MVDMSQLVVLKYWIDKTDKEIEALHKDNQLRKAELARKCPHKHVNAETEVYANTVTVVHICAMCGTFLGGNINGTI